MGGIVLVNQIVVDCWLLINNKKNWGRRFLIKIEKKCKNKLFVQPWWGGKDSKEEEENKGITDYWHNKRRRKIANKKYNGKLKKGL